jgi:hypothetical protein
MRSWWSWIVGAVGLLLVAVVIGSFLIDKPLRQYVERQINGDCEATRCTSAPSLSTLSASPWISKR